MSQVASQNTEKTRTRSVPSVWGRLFRTRESGVFVALLALCVGMSFASPYFLKTENIFNVLDMAGLAQLYRIVDDPSTLPELEGVQLTAYPAK